MSHGGEVVLSCLWWLVCGEHGKWTQNRLLGGEKREKRLICHLFVSFYPSHSGPKQKPQTENVCFRCLSTRMFHTMSLRQTVTSPGINSNHHNIPFLHNQLEAYASRVKKWGQAAFFAVSIAMRLQIHPSPHFHQSTRNLHWKPATKFSLKVDRRHSFRKSFGLDLHLTRKVARGLSYRLSHLHQWCPLDWSPDCEWEAELRQIGQSDREWQEASSFEERKLWRVCYW